MYFIPVKFVHEVCDCGFSNGFGFSIKIRK